MEDGARTGLDDFNLASRKAEEAALRRFQAAGWLEGLVGPLGISDQPSEREFISCLRNGLVLCNAINNINPGAVPKVVENHSHLLSFTRECQPPAAYQYFENVRNFLVAMEELKLPAFEASDLERDTLEAGSSAKIVDCILSLKTYHECKQMNGANGFYKYVRSPMFVQSASRNHTGALSDSCRRLDMSAACEKQPPMHGENHKFEDSIIKVLAGAMVDAKENLDVTLQNGNPDLFKLFSKILPELKVNNSIPVQITSTTLENTTFGNPEHFQAGVKITNRRHKHLFQMQEKELLDLKLLLSRTRNEFEDFQSQLQRDMKELGSQVEEMSTAALGYYKVVQENRKLYNMVQDLKGNIRVYCRIRPAFGGETRNVIDYIGEDGSLVILDPSKPQKDGRKVFQFNQVFGPTAKQGEVFVDTQPLIRSVMDGYNVCIFAYGQTGSGKTYTMSGPSGGSTKDMGINYLALNDLFHMSHRRKDIINYDIYVQMVEIYNEQVRDLLAEDSSTTKLEIRSCSDNGLSIPDAMMRPVKSTNDVISLMKLGEMNRAVSSTAINDRSSRSHSVLTVHVRGKDVSGSTLRSCMHLVDLAGSERVDKSEVTGDRLKEAQYINKSLSCLGDVITALAQKNSHIPYRNSKLTLLLQDSLGGHAKTLMFAHVSPEGDSFGETVSTLKFAQRVSTIELGAAQSNKESSEVMRLKEQIENLKKALADKEAQSTLSKTPPRARRLSIENGNSVVKTEKLINTEDRRKASKTPSLPARARRLSLEGPKYSEKDSSQMKVSLAKKPLPFEAVPIEKYDQFQEQQEVSHISNGSSTIMEAYHPRARRSPTSSSYQKQAVKPVSRTQIPSLQLPRTPEARTICKSEVQSVVDSRSTNGKESQIRKSLRTIGKLINGSEKRNQQNMAEARSPIRSSSIVNNGKSPTTASNSRALRRQSLTGVRTSGYDVSRRSSIGGKPDDSCTNDTRHAKTPPPVHPSANVMKRWM